MMEEFITELKEYTEHYLKMGLTPIKVKFRDKAPAGPWESATITRKNFSEQLGDGPWNIGILCGKKSRGLIVFDYESQEAIAEHYAVLEEYGLTELFETWIVETGKGAHVYFLIDWKDPNASVMIKTVSIGKLFSSLEIRGEGALVVAPPSIHPSGIRYKFILGPYLPIRTITSREYAILLYTYAKTGDITSVKFEELHDILSELYPSYQEVELQPPREPSGISQISERFYAKLPVTEDVNSTTIAELVRPYLKYLPRQDFTLTLASALARLGLHPLKSAEVLANLLDDPEFTRKRSPSDGQPPQEAKKRVQAWVYAYNNVWMTLRGKSLEEDFPEIKNEFITLLKERSELFAESIRDNWWYAPNSGSKERLRGIPTLTGMIADAISRKYEQEGKSISSEAAKEEASRIVRRIISTVKPGRRKVEQFARNTRVYIMGIANERYISLRSELFDFLIDKLNKSSVGYHFGRPSDGQKTEVYFKIKTLRVLFQDKRGLIWKGKKKIYYFRYLSDEWQIFDSELIPETPLTSKPIELIKLIFYRGMTFIKLYVGGAVLEGPVEKVVEDLARNGVTTSHEKELLKKYFTWLSRIHKGNAYFAPGIYEANHGKFVAALPNTTDVLLPNSPLAAEVTDKLKEWSLKITEEEYEEFLEGIIKYREFLPPHVYYASMAYMGIAGFLSAIIDLTGIKPALLFLGRTAGTGKSHIAQFIAVNAYGSYVWESSAYRSDFRFDELFSASTFPVLLDDIHEYNSKKLADLKAILTSNAKSFRGRGIASVKLYELTAVPVFTANELVPEFENDTALMDRLIILELNTPLDNRKKQRYRQELDGPVGITRGIVYAPYFVKELVDVANDLGGKHFIKGRFRKWYDYAVQNNIVEGRDPEKFATLMVGAELLAALLHRHGLTFDIEEAARYISEVFNEREIRVPQELEDLIQAVSIEKKGIILERGLLISTKTLAELRKDYPGWKIPRKPRIVAKYLEGMGYKLEEILPQKGAYVPELKKQVYGVIIPWEIINEVINGHITKEGEIGFKLADEVVNVLSMEPNLTFDELIERINAPEEELSKTVRWLIDNGIVLPEEGRYKLNETKAKEAGFNIVETFVSKRAPGTANQAAPG
ncbi:bifunctional DNA primase/polymerase [Thermococcus sp. 21S7]|uniref:bifunctional DNA primase/polymerase n=1 Tax=Thermococcus sp. 21S7 TaxID=1638221 RepID=UPI0014391E84|nr:bifunctional DNA primase/polymerase [Thermococcus sp. 21S7]